MLAYQLSSVEASQEFTIPFLSMNLEIISFDISPKVFPAFGNAEITITGKVKYFPRRRNTIKYSINNERYQTLTSFNSFSTTPSTSIDVTNLIIPIPAPEIPFNETINFSIPNRFNSREFSVSLISIVEESYSVPKSLTFKDIFKVIFLDMSIQDNQEFINNDGKSFHIEGMIYNFGSSKPINLMYKFDDKDSKILKTYENIGNEGDHVQLDIPLSSDLPESNNHTISIWAEKGFNRKSNEYILNFSFIYNRPNIEGTTISTSPYTKNINDNIAFEGTVSDNDGNGIVSVYCRFDNETENKMMSKQIINAQNEKYALNFTVKIPPSLTEDFHIIYIWAVDSNQKESDYLHFQFYFKHNEPSISITTDNNMQIRKGINNKLEIKGNVIDLDGSGSILIYYIIDNSTEQYLETITIYNTSYHEFNKKIDLPANLNEEIHEIRIYCKDGNLKKSNEEIINFMYLFNNPSIIVNKEPLSIYHNKIDTNISVSGTFTNDNYADNIYFFYVIDNRDRQKIEDVTITNEYEFTILISTSEYFEQFDSESTHSLSIWIVDSFGKSSKYTKTFEFVFNSPILFVSAENFTTLSRTTDKSINIEGTIQDLDCTGLISVFYKFDDNLFRELHSENMNTECGISFSKQIEFPSTFSESLHNITIYCSDEHNKISNEEHIFLYYQYNSPELTINTFENGPYYRCLNKSIHLEGNIVDLDGIGQVIITCYIDDNIIDTKTIDILNVSEHLFTFDLEFPPDISESSHYLIVTAVDESNKSSTPFRLDFQYIYNSPLLTITTQNNQEFMKNASNSFYITGSLVDEDKCGNVTLYYKFDGSYEVNIAFYNITEIYKHYIIICVPFPSDFKENKNHNITIWAIDETNKTSEIIIKNFSYIYNDPIFKLYNFTKTKLIRGSKHYINFTYEHQDNTKLKSLNISFDGNYNIRLDNTISTPSNIIQHTEKINIPNDIEIGKHIIYLYGCDIYNHCKKSNEIEINVIKYFSTKEVDFDFVKNFKIRPKHYH